MYLFNYEINANDARKNKTKQQEQKLNLEIMKDTSLCLIYTPKPLQYTIYRI